jgi:hypothetical protein
MYFNKLHCLSFLLKAIWRLPQAGIIFLFSLQNDYENLLSNVADVRMTETELAVFQVNLQTFNY